MLSIRTAAIADIPLIQNITYKVWPATYEAILTPDQMMYSTAALTRQISELQHSFLLLYEDEQPIGFASYSTTNTPGVYKLHKIYLDRASQGKGAGKFLLNAVAERVKAADAHILELDVNRHNKARTFYEKQGFSVFSEKDTDIGNGFFMNDYVMRKTL